MIQIVRNVRDIAADDRPALEHVVGQTLLDNQQLIIQVADVETSAEAPAAPTQTLADWSAVYEGLSNDQIESLDNNINTRANLTRNLPQLNG